MKILFFIEDLNSGGKERRLVELIKGLSNNQEVEMGIVLTRDIIHYKDIYKTDVKFFFAKRKDGLKKDFRVFYRFYKITKVFKPDFIHVWGNLVAIYAIPAKLFLKIPMINSQITDAPSRVINSILSHKLSFPFSDKIISNTYAGLKAYNAPKRRSSVIYNGFDFERISNLEEKHRVRKRFGISTRYIAGMVASFSENKDYKTYIEAANKVLTERKDITFLCIGSGSSGEFELMVKKANRKNILFLGRQDKVESIMNICDIGVLITNNEKHGEGISNALLEFCALSKPVIATLGGGNGELIEQGKTGFLIEPKSSNELNNKILFFLNNEDAKNKFGRNGKERVKKEFSIEKMIINFVNIYKEIIAKC